MDYSLKLFYVGSWSFTYFNKDQIEEKKIYIYLFKHLRIVMIYICMMFYGILCEMNGLHIKDV